MLRRLAWNARHPLSFSVVSTAVSRMCAVDVQARPFPACEEGYRWNGFSVLFAFLFLRYRTVVARTSLDEPKGNQLDLRSNFCLFYVQRSTSLNYFITAHLFLISLGRLFSSFPEAWRQNKWRRWNRFHWIRELETKSCLYVVCANSNPKRKPTAPDYWLLLLPLIVNLETLIVSSFSRYLSVAFLRVHKSLRSEPRPFEMTNVWTFLSGWARHADANYRYLGSLEWTW